MPARRRATAGFAALALIPAVRRFLVQPRPRPGSGGAADPSGGGGGRGTAMPPRAAGMRAIAAVAFGSAVVAQLAFYMIPTQLPFYLTALTGANGTRSGLAIAGSVHGAGKRLWRSRGKSRRYRQGTCQQTNCENAAQALLRPTHVCVPISARVRKYHQIEGAGAFAEDQDRAPESAAFALGAS